ncbi:MAG: MFS transporter [Actinomycetota bacterium]|nr:MFS transporter [Actinomycetota bacterium]
MSRVLAALHGSMFGIGLLLWGTFGVRLVDRIGRRRALAASALGMVAGVSLFCVGPSWPVTLGGAAIAGAAGALLVMVMPGLISDHHGEHRAVAFSAINGAPAVAGIGFSLVVGAALGVGWSWRPPYLLLTLVIAGAVVAVGAPVRLPVVQREGRFSLARFREREVLVPWLHIVNAVLVEFSVGVWAVTYLREVGGASSGAAPAMAAVFGVTMFLFRVQLPRVLQLLGAHTITVAFVVAGAGAALMCFGPGLGTKVLGLALVGAGGSPLYPLTVDRFYLRAGRSLDSVSLGAYSALASGAAVTLGPLALGVVADTVELRWAILVVPLLAAIGAVTQRA